MYDTHCQNLRFYFRRRFLQGAQKGEVNPDLLLLLELHPGDEIPGYPAGIPVTVIPVTVIPVYRVGYTHHDHTYMQSRVYPRQSYHTRMPSRVYTPRLVTLLTKPQWPSVKPVSETECRGGDDGARVDPAGVQTLLPREDSDQAWRQ